MGTGQSHTSVSGLVNKKENGSGPSDIYSMVYTVRAVLNMVVNGSTIVICSKAVISGISHSWLLVCLDFIPHTGLVTNELVVIANHLFQLVFSTLINFCFVLTTVI